MGQNVEGASTRVTIRSLTISPIRPLQIPVPRTQSEPLTGWVVRAYQMRRSGKQVIYVLPLNKPFAEVGVMIDAAATQDILEEVTALLRQRGLPSLIWGSVEGARASAAHML